MKKLKAIVSYCYDCIKNEDILEKDISINVRTKAVLYPFDNDPFIFNSSVDRVNVSLSDKLEKILALTEERCPGMECISRSIPYEVELNR